jgi:hypothetical protein
MAEKKVALKESLKQKIQEEMDKKSKVANKLANKWKPILESKDYEPVKRNDHNTLSVMLECQHQYAIKEAKRQGMKALTESNISDTSSIQPYLKILVPTLRRMYKQMSAMELVGTQPLSAPQGFIYALRFMYAGDDAHRLARPSNLDRLSGEELNFMSYAMTFQFTTGGVFSDIKWDDPSFGGSYIVKSTSTTVTPDAELDSKTLAQLKSDGTAVVYGQLCYAESNQPGNIGNAGVGDLSTDTVAKVAINRYVDGANVAPILTSTEVIKDAGNHIALWLVNMNTSGAITSKKQIDDILMVNKNEMGFDFIFRNYATVVSTSDAEYMGSTETGAKKFRSLKMVIERKNVVAEYRKLKIQYSDELYEQLKDQHGLNAADELSKMAELEIANEINEMILQAIYKTATVVRGWNYGKPGIAQQLSNLTGDVADGLDMVKKFETLATKIRNEANQIGKETRRGAANYCVVSINVLTALQATSTFSPAGGDDPLASGLSYAGSLGKMKIYVDTYNMINGDFCLVGLKGNNSQNDAGIVFSPYIPLQVKKAVDPDTLQDVIGFRTAYALTTTLWGANRYYRLFPVDLTGSMIGSV